jgi:hypothetical protein
MALQKTPLVIVAAPLPVDFLGDPQEFFEALVERMEIQSPSGTAFFVISDSEPNGNQGPWVRNSNQWWFFNAARGRYVPQDISPSLHVFLVGPDVPPAPTEDQPEVLWLRTFETRAVGWYGWDGTQWRPFNSVPASGATSARPTNPFPLEQFFDTDINALIHFERGAWRTVSGSPGDVKAVVAPLLSDALTGNPGWAYLGQDNQSLRGRIIGIATQDPGSSPAASFQTDSGISSRESASQVGEESHVLASNEIEQHTHLTGHATALNSDNNIQLHRAENTDDIAIPPIVPPNGFTCLGDGSANGTTNGSIGNGATGTMFITSRQLSLANAANYTGVAVAHNNMQPTVFFWHLVKL